MIILTSLLFIGQIVFLTIGFTKGIGDWELEGIYAIGLGVFGFLILDSFLLICFGASRYWSYDDSGITNGNIFAKKTILFKDVDFFEEKYIVIGSKPFVVTQKNVCFYKKKKCVSIPCECLDDEEIEWIKSKITIDK